MAATEKGAGELGASILPIHITVRVGKFTSCNGVAHSLAASYSINDAESNVIIGLDGSREVTERLRVAIGWNRRSRRWSGTSCRRSGTSCRRSGTSCRRSGTSCRRSGTSCRRSGALQSVGEVLQDPADDPSEARVSLVFGRFLAEVPSWLASIPRRGRSTVVITVADIESNDISKVEWVGNGARHRNSNYSEERSETHGRIYSWSL